MRLDYLRYFDHLAEVLNYTRAAEDLFIAQPTLSVAIKRMEKSSVSSCFSAARAQRVSNLPKWARRITSMLHWR